MLDSSNPKTYHKLGTLQGVEVSSKKRPVVCIQGLGFVGSAMAVAVAMAKDNNGEPFFNVIGVDLPNLMGNNRVKLINGGNFPIQNNDVLLSECFQKVYAQGNIFATTDETCFSIANIALVDINLDVENLSQDKASVNWANFKKAISCLGKYLQPNSLIIVETTVPPGTTKKIVVPAIEQELSQRKLPIDSIHVAHSYERVMPGENYLSSIINYWRVYSGHTEVAADLCENFLSKIINIQDYPLWRLKSTIDSEAAKILENTYRAVNIAFIAEWGKYAEKRGIELFNIIKAIRCRPTHSNIMQPGFGVGGYCLPKDPAFISISSRDLYKDDELRMPVTELALQINRHMPNNSVIIAKRMLGGNIKGKCILLLGISYRSDVGDTRNSPSQYFFEKMIAEGADVICYDPLVEYWEEIGIHTARKIPEADGLDLVVFAVKHEEFKKLEISKWIQENKLLVLDANDVLTFNQRSEFESRDCPVTIIGSGDSND